MNDWPEPSSTVVSARRVVSAGTVKPLSLTEPASLSSLTSGRTRIEMRPSARTIGVNARPTPYCLYSMVTAPSACETGIGNSPPARKLAVSPDSAVRFGSASVVTRPSFCSRSSVPSRSSAEDACRTGRASCRRRVVERDAGTARTCAGDRIGVPGRQTSIVPGLPLADAEQEPPVRVAAEQVDADLLEQRAVDLGDADLQHHLKRRRRLEAVDRHDVERASLDMSRPG